MTNIKEVAINKVMEFTPLIRMLLMIALFLIIIIIGYFFDLKPGLLKSTQLHTQQVSLRDQYVVKYRRYQELLNYKQLIEQLKIQNKSLLILITHKREMTQLLRKISELGADSNLKIGYVDPLAEKENDFYIIQPVRLKVTGNYHQIASFVNRLSKLSRLINFSKFIINYKGTNNENEVPGSVYQDLDLNLEFNTYYYDINKKLDLSKVVEFLERGVA